MPQRLVVFLLLFSSFAFSQTADELIAKNIQAKGGMDKIKAIKTVRISGKLDAAGGFTGDRKSTRLNSSHLVISYAVFCLKKKKGLRDFRRECTGFLPGRSNGRQARRRSPLAAIWI